MGDLCFCFLPRPPLGLTVGGILQQGLDIGRVIYTGRQRTSSWQSLGHCDGGDNKNMAHWRGLYGSKGPGLVQWLGVTLLLTLAFLALLQIFGSPLEQFYDRIVSLIRAL